MPRNRDANGFTEKELRFIDEYMIDLSKKNAAIRAGYSPATAKEIGSSLYARPKIREKVS